MAGARSVGRVFGLSCCLTLVLGLYVAGADKAGADAAIQTNVAGAHEIENPNSPGWYTEPILLSGDYHHMRLAYDRLAYGMPEVISMNEMCISQAKNFENWLNYLWPNQYKTRFGNAFFYGGGPEGACQYYPTPNPAVNGFGNFLAVRANNYTPWSNGGVVNYNGPFVYGKEYKVWTCMDGGAASVRFTACTTHFWPADLEGRATWACTAMPWVRDNLMYPYYNRHSNFVLLGDLYLTRNAPIGGSVAGTINGCTVGSMPPPGLLGPWRSNFATGTGPNDNSQTMGIANYQVDHIITDGSHNFALGSGFTFKLSNCPNGTTFEQCNLTDHRLVYASPNI